jgi:ABC-2 type transport system ATP-binding protein
MIGGLRTRDGGTVDVLGHDPDTDGAALRELVGFQLQESALPARITVREALGLYASFYRDGAGPAEQATLLAELGLAGKAGARFQALSGGQKQRLSLALALVGHPQIAILDELSTGLDPQARRDTWDVVRRVRERGVTILLVTHLMEEAERLCDRVVLVDAGQVVAEGSPVEVAARVGAGDRLAFRPSTPVDLTLLTTLPTVAEAVQDGGTVHVRGSGNVVQDVMVALARAGARPEDLRVDRTTLEDAFVTLTGTTPTPVEA